MSTNREQRVPCCRLMVDHTYVPNTVRQFNWWCYCWAVCDTKFSLFDETLHHVKLCNSIVNQIQRNPPKNFQYSMSIVYQGWEPLPFDPAPAQLKSRCWLVVSGYGSRSGSGSGCKAQPNLLTCVQKKNCKNVLKTLAFTWKSSIFTRTLYV